MSETTQNPIQALHALEKHLSEQTEHGVERAYISPTALADLNSLRAAVQAAAPKRAPAPQPPAPVPAPAPVEPSPAAIRKIEQTPPLPEPPNTPGSDEKRLQLREIAIRAKRCEQTRSLGTLRSDFVFANGNPDADLMFIGEAPGMEEEKKHRPFVGPAGQLLDKIVKVMGFERDEVYLSNIVKFRPSTGAPNQGTRNRKPTAEEMATSVKYVLEEIAVVQPKVIVALGGTTMEGLLGLEGNLDSHRSKFHTLRNIPVMITHHPSHLLRSGEKIEKRKVWEDLLLVMERLGLPISANQRSFFL
ncbi:MAG: uracil-DNA glycosylase family 4 [Verrucomicrobiales bacterium]